jgi:hypothetical protein
MSAAVTNRVLIPNRRPLYVSDDVAGDNRLEELYILYGNLPLEACNKEPGRSLDDLTPFWTGTIEEFFS